MAKSFDPAEFTVDEVNEYLEKADEEERARILADEEAGKGRTTILHGPHGEVAADKHPFVKDAGALAEDVSEFVLETQKRLDELVDAHDKAKAASVGDAAHREVAYALQRVASMFSDINRDLTATASVAGTLAGEVAAVEG